MSLEDFRRSFYQLSCFPRSRAYYGVRDLFIIWEGEVQPFWYTNKYTLCLNYERLWPPRIWVVNPDFSTLKGLPHVYAGNRLCLYHPSDWSWKSSCNITDTIIRWAQMWLVYFEDYLRTGIWRGPEAEHKVALRSDDDMERRATARKDHHREKPAYLKNYPIRLSSALNARKNRQKKRR